MAATSMSADPVSGSVGKCAGCGSSAGDLQRCARCKSVSYCSLECQKKGWREGHKQQCKQVCLRCHETYVEGPTACKVPHPALFTRNMGGLYAAEKTETDFHCDACSASWKEVTWKRDGGETEGPEILGPRWCFHGSHTLESVPKSDKRVVDPKSLSLSEGEGLQKSVDDLPSKAPGLRSLIVWGKNNDSLGPFVVCPQLSRLTKLHVLNLNTGRVVLTENTTPALRELRLENIPDECEMEIRLPELREVEMNYVIGSARWGGGDHGGAVRSMLEAATKLKKFKAYKILQRDGGELRFASNSLEEVTVWRSDCLDAVSVWAPRLRNLSVRACYDIKAVTLLTDHPLKRELAEETPMSTGIVVELTNSGLPERERASLRRNPRVGQVVEDEEEW